MFAIRQRTFCLKRGKTKAIHHNDNSEFIFDLIGNNNEIILIYLNQEKETIIFFMDR